MSLPTTLPRVIGGLLLIGGLLQLPLIFTADQWEGTDFVMVIALSALMLMVGAFLVRRRPHER